MMELIDTHCHLGFKELASDFDGVLARSRAAGVVEWINVGTDSEQNRKVVETAEKYEDMYAAVGIHPHYAKDVGGEDVAELKKLAANGRVVAIGETGLDFHYNFSKWQDQQRIFAAQLQIAAEFNLPAIIHSREAFDETIELLERFGAGVPRIVFHCFSYSAAQARIVVENGYYISFTGVVTFKNADDVRRAAEVVPLEKLMVETDCPYMSPAPMRKQKVNEPALLVHTARSLAELKGVEMGEFARAVTGASREFFGLPQNR